MKKLFTKIYKWGCAFSNDIWWPIWSNIRWRKVERFSKVVNPEDQASDLVSIKLLVKKLYLRYTWTKDGLDQLGDSLCPPPYNYGRYLNGELKDDCDGFHSLVYHCLTNSGIKCYLLSVVTKKSGHCVLLFKLNDKWYVNDYAKVYGAYNTALEASEDYAKIYPVKYNKPDFAVVYYGLTIYNYETGKFKAAHYNKL